MKPWLRRRKNTARVLTVSARSASAVHGALRCGGRIMRCALGRGGRTARKREGDGATPIGLFRLGPVLYRADRGRRPLTALPVRAIRRTDGWCDAPGDRNYNRAVHLPYPASAETMWRGDHLYDLVVVLDYNVSPRRRGVGSAIFMHIAEPGYAPTAGCIALASRDLRLLLARLGRRASLRVVP
jgi:L,D-peptidoglycan transpeptidase YkuD (ErfK/YbiS/YcfS/YnhG family)